SWILPAQSGLAAALEGVARELGLDFESAPAVPDVPRHAAPVARIGVWVPWADTDSIGWIRYTLDQQRVPYAYLRDEDVRAGGLVRFVRRASIEGFSTPGVELKARFARPDHPIAYGYGRTTSVFRSNYPVYDTPLRWTEMSYCTTCLDGPTDRGPVVLEWGAD